MYLVKTPEGQQAFKERHVDLSQRLRSAFLLFDGRRSLLQVLDVTAAMGVCKDDILALVGKGWLATLEPPVMAGGAAVEQAQPTKNALPSLAPAKLEADSNAQRYRQAYPMAVSITGALGLKGFRLNLAVEAAMGYAQLVALAPRIRDAAGDKAYAPLHKALFEAEGD